MGILVLDVGTSSMRGVLFNEKADLLCQVRSVYQPIFHSSICVTQDPKIWKNALFEIVHKVQNWCEMHEETIELISLTAQRTSVIPVDRNGNSIAEAIMWQDKRNATLCKNMQIYNGEIIRRSGTMINPVFSGSKMAWIKREKPELYHQAYKLLVVADYLFYQMTEQYKTDRTYASRSHLMNLRSGEWDPQLLRIFQIEESKLCELINPGEVLGYTTKTFAKATGIKSGIPVYSAGGDQQCAALGMGICEEGEMEVTSGTGAFMIGMTKKLPPMFLGSPIINYSAVRGTYIVEASILTCSAAFDWLCQNFYKDYTGNIYHKIDEEVRNSPPGANGCMLLPFFQGRATPLWNSKATASFTNVTLSTTRGDMARALLEGIACEIRNNMDIIEGQIGRAKKIWIGGGLSKSRVFNQIQADIYGRSLFQYSNEESTMLGAWISAMVYSGRIENMKEAIYLSRAKDSVMKYVPVEENIEIYTEIRKNMNQLYHKLYI